jgi:apolipoprotein D and lipocalin family protein
MTALALMLFGCAPPAPDRTSLFRSAEAPIYSAAAFDASQLEGRWVQVAMFAAPGATGCAAGSADFVPSDAGIGLNAELCLDGVSRKVSGRIKSVGPGRLAIEGMEDWWIVWVDSGYRTLAVGTPSGRFGFILDRGNIPGDRLAAAREVFDFNGYVTSALNTF